jgi:hypothetical protein
MAAAWLVVLLTVHRLLHLSGVSAVDRSQFPPDFLFGTSSSAYQARRRNPHSTMLHNKSLSELCFFRLKADIWRVTKVSATGMSSLISKVNKA